MDMTLAKTKPSDEWATPEVVFKACEWVTGARFGLDACATNHNSKCANYFSQEHDGLGVDWDGHGDVWWNPPYSNIPAWCEQANLQRYNEGVRSVGLLRSDSSTKWFHRYSIMASTVWLLTPRIKFLPADGEADSTSNPFGSVLFDFNPKLNPPVSGSPNVHLFTWKEWAKNYEPQLLDDYTKRIR